MVKSEMQQLDLKSDATHSDSIKKYFNFYKLDYPNVSHSFGWFKSDNYKLASHVFKPQTPKGTMVILHGYFDHTGIIAPLIDICLKENFTVATIDFPGHGLSDGNRGAINDFNEYAFALDRFLKAYKASLPSPVYFMGHSTGCAAIYEYLNIRGASNQEKIIFLGPLVRTHLWGPSKAAYFFTKPFVKKLPRKYRKNTANKTFIEFIKNDPLEGQYVASIWFKALSDWNNRIKAYPTITNPMLILQGEQDKTVDWKYNMAFLKTKCSNVKIRQIKEGGHQLAHETSGVMKIITQEIHLFLKQ